MRVTLRDKSGNPLADLIIGKEVPDRKELRYVRRANEDPVYEVRMRTDKLSANFGDWIEKDLLKLNTWDIKGVQIFDYSLDIVNGTILQRGQMALEYSSDDSKWKLLEDRAFDNGKWVPLSMAPDEELNTQKLDDLKYALGDLKIVDVARKPAGLSANLRDTGALKKDRRSLESLMQRGFYPARTEGGTEELLSTEGEIRVAMKDGVVYLLRFGNIAGTTSPAPKSPESKDDKDKPAGVNRYLFVMAEFHPDLIEKPKLEPLPPETKPEPKKPAESKKEEPNKEAKKEETKKDQPGSEAKPDAPSERERIEKENKKKEDEYKEKLKKGEERVKELNGRFADWYYVIADDVYRKIHLGRKDIIKKKEKKEEEKKEEAKSEEPKAPANSPAEMDELKRAVPAPKGAPGAESPAPAPAPAPPEQKTPEQKPPAETKPQAEPKASAEAGKGAPASSPAPPASTPPAKK